jgi:hypothetical protein
MGNMKAPRNLVPFQANLSTKNLPRTVRVLNHIRLAQDQLRVSLNFSLGNRIGIKHFTTLYGVASLYTKKMDELGTLHQTYLDTCVKREKCLHMLKLILSQCII